MDVAQALAVRDPGNAEWQRDLSVSYENIGDALLALGDAAAAQAAYRRGLVLLEPLAARNLLNTQGRSDLSDLRAKAESVG